MSGTFVVSLDFELLWGIHDTGASRAGWRERLLGARDAVGVLLRTFSDRGVRATWAAVGALFCATREELLAAAPALSTFDVGRNEAADPFHFAPSLIRAIASTPGQELATHTFSHFCCLEAGQTAEDFDADLVAAQRLAAPYGGVRSLVFPRNQYNPAYRDVLVRRGIHTYRSNGRFWAYRPAPRGEPRVKRLVRLIDAYVPVAGARTHRVVPAADGLTDVPASAFLRPHVPALRHLDPLRVERIRRGMTHAAERRECFHLWWHPHNFGTHLRENMATLHTILDHFDVLRRRERMESVPMGDFARRPGRPVDA